MIDTLLELEGMGVTLYSTRGATMQITPIQGSIVLRRTVNQDLDDLSNPLSRKYAIKISCSDQATPALDGVFPGAEIIIHSCMELAYAEGGHATRPEVSGSSRSDGDFTYYRPIFDCRCTNFSSQFDEWNATYSWEMDFEEK